MNSLVTGSTGFLGSVLTKTLLKNGIHTKVLVRDPNRLDKTIYNKAEIIKGDIVNENDVMRATEDVENVYHIAAVYRTAGISDDVYRDVHVKGTENLLNASLKRKVKKFIHCSTVGVHGHIKNPPADESYPFNPGDIYQVTKLEGENIALDFFKKTGLPVTVIRPGAIYGPGDTRLLKLFKLASKNPKFILGSGDIFYHLAYVEDLANAFILASEKENAVGETFIVCNNEVPTLNELIDIISDHLNKPGKIVHLPAKPFQILGSISEKIFIPFGINPPIHRRRVDFFTKSRSFDISKAKKILNFEPRYDLDKGIRNTIEWYNEMGYLK